MKGRIGGALLCLATLAAVLAAVLLPPRLSALADSELAGRSYTARAGDFNVSLVYELSVPERLALIAGSDTVQLHPEGGPAQDEMDADQAFLVCKEELNMLVEMGILPLSFPILGFLEREYYVLFDQSNPQRSLALWFLKVVDGEKYPTRTAEVVMDAQTGLIYGLSYTDSDGFDAPDLHDLSWEWGEYLALGAADDIDYAETPYESWDSSQSPVSSDGITDHQQPQYAYVKQGGKYLWVKYQADGLSIPYRFDFDAISDDSGLGHILRLYPISSEEDFP